MSERNNASGVGKLAVTLGSICAVCALLLGMTNAATAGRIAAVQKDKNDRAMAQVLPITGEYTPVEYTGGDATVQSVYRAGEEGCVVEVSPASSFSGTLTIMVGVKTDGTVSGVVVTKSGETSGLGDNAKRADFREQFVGQLGEVKVTKDGGSINALTGATITSRAVAAGVTSALAVAAELG